LEYIRLSQQSKDQLVKIKRMTGIPNWNVICRWAFCVSIAEVTAPPFSKVVADSNLEMTWKVFGGEHADLYKSILLERCKADGLVINEETFATQFRLHLQRGIGYLAADKRIKDISTFIASAMSKELKVLDIYKQ